MKGKIWREGGYWDGASALPAPATKTNNCRDILDCFTWRLIQLKHHHQRRLPLHASICKTCEGIAHSPSVTADSSPSLFLICALKNKNYSIRGHTPFK